MAAARRPGDVGAGISSLHHQAPHPRAVAAAVQNSRVDDPELPRWAHCAEVPGSARGMADYFTAVLPG